MYGLKEKGIGKLLVRIIKIDKNSEDGYNLLNWKLPGQKAATSMAGDFAGRCYEVLSKRAMRATPGDMSIEEVNDMLDRLALAGKENDQLPIMEEFYQRMNAEEMMWLIRMILRQMKIGATEKTIFDIWHPDAETLFNISSNLRRVCWELYDQGTRLEGEDTDITLMQCFQPQLAQFQEHSFERLVKKLRPTEADPFFWIEEKLDGERMQLHMIEDDSQPGGKRFGFWSRKAKDYTYLYGSNFYDENSALTRHLRDAFHKGVRNIILDGEMITWDPEINKTVPFGTLKTAAISEQKNPFGTGQRPLYRVFDILLLNDQALTKYTLRERRKALVEAVKAIYQRMEIHDYTEARSAADIDPLLQKVVAEASEGLVLKSPRSMYRLNERNDDWIKVKPEYMTEFGEDLDCVVIGGYYGSGRRGGNLSSFMCGLRVDAPQIAAGANRMKCYSFFRVGGGFSASDYAEIRHKTEGKWQDWDPKRPPTEFIELAGGDKQSERPDVWIRPDDSIVLSVKAASVAASPLFRVNMTLRFPRFKKLRTDKGWEQALSMMEFVNLKNNVEQERENKKFTLDDERRKKRSRVKRKKSLVVAGAEEVDHKHLFTSEESTNVFAGLNFFVMTDVSAPEKRSRVELQALVKRHGGAIFQDQAAADPIICIGDRDVLKTKSIKLSKTHSIIRPSWVFDCITQARRDAQLGMAPLLLPYEYDRHVYFARDEDADMMGVGVAAVTGDVGFAADRFGDGFARDLLAVEDLRELMKKMPAKFEESFDTGHFVAELEEHGYGLGEMAGWMFKDCVVCFVETAEEDGMDINGSNGPDDAPLSLDLRLAANIVEFAGGSRSAGLGDRKTTHVVLATSDRPKGQWVREQMHRYGTFRRSTTGRSSQWLTRLSRRSKHLPRIVTMGWIQQSWAEKTLLDEEREHDRPCYYSSVANIEVDSGFAVV